MSHKFTTGEQRNTVYASADDKMHPDRGALATGAPRHGTIGTVVNPPL